MWSFEGRTGILVLSCLYYLQGFPFGFGTNALPLIIKASYSEAGLISIATYPYAAKVLWSPIVDTFWVKAIDLPRVQLGRRKSWIVPCTLFASCLLFYLASTLQTLQELQTLETPAASAERLNLVRGVVLQLLLIIVCMATQDIATDGWALTLSRDYLPFAATCQTMGLTAGAAIGFPVLLALTSNRLWEFLGRLYGYTAGVDAAENTFEALSVGAVLRGQGFICIVVGLAIAFCVSEDSLNSAKQERPVEHSHSTHAGSRKAVATDMRGRHRRRSKSKIESKSSHASQKSTSTSSSSSSWSEAAVLYRRVLAMVRDRRCRPLLLVLTTIRLPLAALDTLPLLTFMLLGGNIEQLGLAMIMKYPLEMALSVRASASVSAGARSPLQLWAASYRHMLLVAAMVPSVLLLVRGAQQQHGEQHGAQQHDEQKQRSELPLWAVVLFAVAMAAFHTLNKGFFTAQGLYFNSLSAAVSVSASRQPVDAQLLATDKVVEEMDEEDEEVQAKAEAQEPSEELECGGTVVTLLNTIANIGRFVPQTIAACLADVAPGGYFTVAYALVIAGVVLDAPLQSSIRELEGRGRGKGANAEADTGGVQDVLREISTGRDDRHKGRVQTFS